MERGPVSLRIGETFRHESGLTIRADIRQRKRLPVSEVALHEAAHVVVAGQIQSVTIVPTSEYQGATRPAVMTAASAMAAYAMGFGGTGWDEFLTEHILGVDPGAAASSAAATLAGRQEEMLGVAEALEERKTIGQGDVEEVYAGVDARRRGIHEVAVTVAKPDGEETVHETKSNAGVVMVPGEWCEIGLDTAKQ